MADISKYMKPTNSQYSGHKKKRFVMATSKYTKQAIRSLTFCKIVYKISL